jgi:hypothetical protein
MPWPFFMPLFTKCLEWVFSEVRSLRKVRKITHLGDTLIPCLLDTYGAIASRGGGLKPFFFRPSKEG